MEQALALALRQRAVAAIEMSNTMLRVAESLLQQGNRREAARLRNEARYKRNESVLLMDQAAEIGRRQSNVLEFKQKNSSRATHETEPSANGREVRRFRSG